MCSLSSKIQGGHAMVVPSDLPHMTISMSGTVSISKLTPASMGSACDPQILMPRCWIRRIVQPRDCLVIAENFHLVGVRSNGEMDESGEEQAEADARRRGTRGRTNDFGLGRASSWMSNQNAARSSWPDIRERSFSGRRKSDGSHGSGYRFDGRRREGKTRHRRGEIP